MLTIYKSSIKEVKEEMKQAKAGATVLRKSVKEKMKKQKRKPEQLSIRDQKTLAEADWTLSFCEVTRFVPLWLDMPAGRILVNYLMLNEFAKRLKGYRIQATTAYDSVVGQNLILEYSKGNNKGRLELPEMPHSFYKNLERVPEACFDDDLVNVVAKRATKKMAVC